MGGTARHAHNPAARSTGYSSRSRKSFHSSGGTTIFPFFSSGFAFFADGSSSSVELIDETWKIRVKDWRKDAEKPENSEPSVEKKDRLHNPWTARDTKIKELEGENKKLKSKLKEFKQSGCV